ncbi:carbohydrate-binding protein [Actinoplanes sp. NPDC049668]|uniref:carbohydrate-binding protein n=1 Tax=unclassified Actinoplanes TaxID=2626549 RepID=UPI0033BD642F
MPRHSLPPQPTWLRPRLVVAFVVATAGLATAIWLPTRNDSADAAERDRAGNNDRRDRDRSPSLTAFADDFDGKRGSTVDPTKWSLNTDRADNGLQFRESTRNARLDGDGNLTIVLRREDEGGFSSARLLTKDRLRATAGHAEARIKTPEGDARPVFELIGAGRQSFASFEVLTESLSDDFHTYAVDWAPGEAVLSVDGQEVSRVTPEGGLGTDQSFRLALSLATGDDRSGNGLPARMQVDSVSFAAAGATEPPATEPPATEPPTEPPATAPTTEPPATAPTEAPTTEPPTTAPTTEPPTTPPTTAPPATPEWAPFTDYVAGQPVKFKGVEYQVLETHTSLPGWEPTALPSLFKKL